MLSIFVFSLIILLYLSSYQLVWPILCIIALFFYLSIYSSPFSSVLCLAQSFTFSDSLSLIMVLLLFYILYISYVNSLDYGSYKLMSIVFLSLIIFCYEVFTTSHLFYLYFFYEASLIPILYIIIKWGSYPERSLSALIMLIYTLFFGAPVLMLIIYLNSSFGSWYYPIYNFNSSFILTIFIFLCFSVNLPVYGLHFWLPIAHVEAPTFGSVILASILLNLGGVGLLRLIELMSIITLYNSVFSYFIVFIVYSSLVCCYQSDFNRLIAYSSVAHIIVIPFLIISNNALSYQALVLVMLLHGLSSTLLFLSVGILYNIFSSRQLVLLRGLVLVSPLFSFILILTFLFTLSAPPMPSYVAEVFFILSSYILSPYFIYVVLLFAFLGLLYNLNWLVSILFGPDLDIVYSVSNIKFNLFQPLVLTLCSMIPFTILFSVL